MFTIATIISSWTDKKVLTKDKEDKQAIKVQGVTEEFQFNAYGFPMNDIAALNGAKSLQEYNMILQRLQQYQADNPDTSNLTPRELLDSVVPRSFQTPAEIERAATWIGERMDEHYRAKVEELRAKAEEGTKVSAPASTTVVAQPEG